MDNMDKFTGHLVARSGLEIQSHADYIIRTVLSTQTLQEQALWYLRFHDYCDRAMGYKSELTNKILWDTATVTMMRQHVFVEFVSYCHGKRIDRSFPVRLFDRSAMIHAAKQALDKTKEYLKPEVYDEWLQSLEKGILNEV